MTDPGNADVEAGDILSDEQYRKLVMDGANFKVGMGAETIKKTLEELDLEELTKKLKKDMSETKSEAKKTKLAKRMKIASSFKKSGNSPAWMILDSVPVIPPDLRPLVPLDGGRFATSDLNDLYRRVINRNNRLRRLIELNAPENYYKKRKKNASGSGGCPV